MEVHLPAVLHEQILRAAARQGRDADDLIQEALARYLRDESGFIDETDNWTAEERGAVIAHIHEGLAQAERGELISAEQAHLELQELKANWRAARASR